jgi:hypothetical protein
MKDACTTLNLGKLCHSLFSCDSYKNALQRPGWKDFLRNIAAKYEMHVYTMGTRAYAEQVCAAIDPDGKVFGGRLLSRDESGSEFSFGIIFVLAYRNGKVLRKRACNGYSLVIRLW